VSLLLPLQRLFTAGAAAAALAAAVVVDLLFLCRLPFDVSKIRVKRRMKWIAISTSGSYVLDDLN